MSDKTVSYGGNGLCFDVNKEVRPSVQDVGDDEFYLYLEEGNVIIDKDEINDVITLLTEVKRRGYSIDNE